MYVARAGLGGSTGRGLRQVLGEIPGAYDKNPSEARCMHARNELTWQEFVDGLKFFWTVLKAVVRSAATGISFEDAQRFYWEEEDG
jgi:hypothetical protein